MLMSRAEKKLFFFFPQKDFFTFLLCILLQAAERRSGPLRHSPSPQREREETPSDRREPSERRPDSPDICYVQWHLIYLLVQREKQRTRGREGGREEGREWELEVCMCVFPSASDNLRLNSCTRNSDSRHV